MSDAINAALDQTVLTQKNGAVMSHVRIADDLGALGSTRIPDAGTDLVLGSDMVVATSATGADDRRAGPHPGRHQ